MKLNLVEKSEKRFLEGSPGKLLLRNATDAVKLVEACFHNRTKSLLLYSENLTDNFFDLSSLEAGSILQKLRTYKIRLAVVSSPGAVRFSSAFRALLIEENRHNYFRLFEERQKAEAWLLQD